VAASRFERARRPGRSWAQAFSALVPAERLAAFGAMACGASLALPWYSAPVDDLVKTGFGTFDFAKAALVVTVLAALLLLLEVGRGHRPPLPLHEGTLLTAAGLWAAMLIVFSVVDRPEFDLGGFRDSYDLGYGAFVALGGAGLLTLAGLRVRRLEALKERAVSRSAES
jgi:hypothetical protein